MHLYSSVRSRLHSHHLLLSQIYMYTPPQININMLNYSSVYVCEKSERMLDVSTYTRTH